MATSLTDAITVTGATTGQVPCEVTVAIPALTNPQKTALVAFITSLGAAWPGQAANIMGLTLSRTPLAPATITCNIRGLIVFANATSALTAQTAGTVDSSIGIVP